MKWEKRPEQCDAWQFRGEPHPAWISEALSAGLIWWQGGHAPYYTIAASGLRAYPGDWIVRYADGRLWVCSDDAFRCMWQPADAVKINIA